MAGPPKHKKCEHRRVNLDFQEPTYPWDSHGIANGASYPATLATLGAHLELFDRDCQFALCFVIAVEVGNRESPIAVAELCNVVSGDLC